MKDQHTKIKGYRDLSKGEIDLMNRIKCHAEVTKNLLDEVEDMRQTQFEAYDTYKTYGLDHNDLDESLRNIDIARLNLQQGFMWFVRAVALPQSF